MTIKANDLKKLKTEADVRNYAAKKGIRVTGSGSKLILDGGWELFFSNGKLAYFEDKRKVQKRK